MLVLDTGDRQAVELVARAIGAIDSYRRTRTRSSLEQAEMDLRRAAQHDNRYLLPPYYLAVVEDLLGHSRDAAEQLRTILPEAPLDCPDLINEMRYNLAVAQYHGYSHQHLEEAAVTLAKILSDTSSLSGRIQFYRTRLHALALSSRVYAMWSIPRNPEDAKSQSECERIKHCYNTAAFSARTVITSPMLMVFRLKDRHRANEVEAVARNGRGAAEMYYTDFFLSGPSKIRALRQGLRQLRISDRLFSRDWATYCNIASCHMRLGYWGNRAEEFDRARHILEEVVNELRPNYGFALYEIGRSFRIQGCFEKATTYLMQAKKVPEKYREVSDRRVNRELGLAENQSALYP